MSKASDDRIRRWIPVIESIREDLGLTAKLYPTWLVLALIEIESTGNPSAHREGSQFYGLLQIGISASKDIGRKNTDHDGDGELAIDSFFRYSERYARGPTRHNYEPEKISILWKSGPGTVKQYIRLQETAGQAAAEQLLSELWGGTALGYLQKFRRKAKKWSEGKAKLTEPPAVLPSSKVRPSTGDGRAPGGCDNKQPAAFKPFSNADVASSAKKTVEDAVTALQTAGKTWFRTDPVDPDATSLGQTRSVRLIRDNRLETVSAVFPHASSAVTYRKPLTELSVKTGFGSRVGKSDTLLDGVEYDTASNARQPVHAVAEGTVEAVTVTVERGNVVVVNHGGFFLSEYGHLSEVFVSEGDTVQPGDVLAKSGQTLGKSRDPSDPAFFAPQGGAIPRKRKLRAVKVPAIPIGTGKVDDVGYKIFRVREDIAEAYRNVYEAVKAAGGFLPSSGGVRALTATVSRNRSATSMHYTGLAIDLFIHAAMRDPLTDKLVVEVDPVDPRKWIVYSRATNGTTMTLDGWKHSTQSTVSVTDKFINLTDILAAQGYTRIRRRRSYAADNYGAAEWWHFDFKETFVDGVTTFGEVLLTRYTHEQLQGTPPWRFRDAVWSDARGDFVGGRANREIARRKGRRVPPEPESAARVIAVPNARPDPVLFFALTGQANLFDAGQPGGEETVAVDPNAILQTAPGPGEVRAEQRPEDAELAKSRDALGQLTLTAQSQDAFVNAANAYDNVSAFQRSQSLAFASRAELFAQEDSQREVRTVFAQSSVEINPTDY